MAEPYWVDNHAIKFPCKECVERHQACWSECERYKQAKEDQEEKNKKEAEAKKTADDIYRIREKRSTWLKNGFTYNKQKGDQ